MSTKRSKIYDFGFDPEISPNHFAVVHQGSSVVSFVEYLTWDADDQEAVPPKFKAKLYTSHWLRIAEAAANVFNRRLRQDGLRAATWRKTTTRLAPHFGKELVLLAWATEDADLTVIPNIVANWSGLAPEERWWFYTTINATIGHAEHGKDRGWRKAIKIALTENPVQHDLPASALLSSHDYEVEVGGGLPGKSSRRTKKQPTVEAQQQTLPLNGYNHTEQE
jgi:hypothetical protein